MRKKKIIVGVVNILLILCYMLFVSEEKNSISKNILSPEEMKGLVGGGVWTGYKCDVNRPVTCGNYSDPCPPLDIGTSCIRCSGSSFITGCIPATCNDQCVWDIFFCDSFIIGKCSFGTCSGDVDGPDCKTEDCKK
jgi:hypothetical protein